MNPMKLFRNLFAVLALATFTGLAVAQGTVPVSLIATGSVWKYLDDGSDQGTAWRTAAFNDTFWASGPGILGYGDTNEATVLTYGPDMNNKYTNYYFRRFFTVTNVATVSNLVIRLLRDDGAVVYINGAEVRRDNLPAGTITSTTRAVTAIGGAAETTYFATTNTASLVDGTNLVAVEIHQQSGTSSDISFDLELIANEAQGQITNTDPPFVFAELPAPGLVASLTSVQVTFSEGVTGVDASDLLVNGVPASGLSGSGNAYTFTFPQPAFGTVNMTWSSSHGIVDQGSPPLPFDGAAASNRWSYTLMDNIAPTVIAKVPADGSIVTNLTSVQVTFSESVQGVNASDLLVNGSPATGLTINSASSYTFAFAQPPPGSIAISWAASHGIADTSPSANPFDGSGPGATWSYTLTVPATVLISSNSVWRFVKGSNDTSVPDPVWRQIAFDDSSWANSLTPFYYGDPYTNATTGVGTLLSDMQNNYQCILLRKTFVLNSPAGVSNFVYRHQSDDGFVAWMNGVEVLRYNMASAPTDPPYVLATSLPPANEPGGAGAAYIFVTNSLGLANLVAGTNVLAVQAFNASLGGSSDFGFDLQLEATIVEVDPTNLPPRITAVSPPVGDVFSFTSFAVTFSERVQNVNASDLLLDGVPATGVSGTGSNYTFTFPQPPYGSVNVTWAANHGIVDFDNPPKPFDATAPGSTFTYTLLNPSAPTVFSQTPLAGSTVTNLTQIAVVFSEPVIGVDAADLRINGLPAVGLSGSGSNYTFTFPQPAYGSVSISWASSHGITDTEPAHNAFDASRPGATWQYSLIDTTPPTIAAKNPPAGANVTNLVMLTVTFSEVVQGVNASDLLINGIPAVNYGGSGSNYTFVFTQPNTSVVNVEWSPDHGITDTAGNPFSGTGPGETWQYFTPDNVPPDVISITPPPGATVRSLTQIAVTFTEPVTGVGAGDLLANNTPARSVVGSAAGPYTFTFTQPATGEVQIAWAPGHGITDLASPPNNFAGGEWTYVLDPKAVFADKVVMNEIMFQAPSKQISDEWIELLNTDSAPINLNGWKFTKGVDYTFPDVSIPAGGYLVVVADTAAFQSKYPTVTNFVGPWTGDLANHDGNIRLVTPLGEIVNELHYASEGDWATRIRGPLSANHRGWIWRSPAADASGPTLELMNPALPNQSGQNWRSSIATNGTPGAANSVARTNVPPLVLDLAHFPVVPRSTDPVVITAKILDERTNGLAVTLYYRDASTTNPPPFSSLPMFDDGAHNDGVSGDKVFAATIPALPSETVVEFYVEAIDLAGNTNSSPALAYDQNNVPGHYANALYQVDDSVYSFPQPLYKLIMTEAERRERNTIATVDSQSNAEMNGTLITIDGTGTEVRYNIGIRERGAGSRGRIPPNHRVNVPTDRRWKGQREFNLNSQYTHSQYAGYLLSRKSGLDTEYARIVRLTINNTNNANSGLPQFGCYIHVEAPDSDLAAEHWPLDSGGNVYRVAIGNHTADLRYIGTNWMTYSNGGYSKVSNTSENDWSDLINLSSVLNNTPDSNYVAAVRSVANVEQWMLYFAVNTLLVNMETSLGSGYGDDYGLYHAPIENRFYLIAHDWDTVLNEGDTPGSVTASIFRTNGPPTSPTLSRFYSTPEFTSIYYATLRRLCRTTFAPAELWRTLDEGLGSFANTANLTQMKTFASNRVSYVLSLLPPETNAPVIAPNSIGGAVASDVTFAASNSPYTVTSPLTIGNGVTVTIQPGVTVQVASGATITITGTGVLLAIGTPSNHIHFTKSGAGNWGSLDFLNAPNESRIEYADFDSCAGTTIGGHAAEIHVNGGSKVFFNHLNFANVPAQEYISFDGSTFIVQNSTFPTYPWATSAPEMLHGINGINAGGYGIFRSNYFGHTFGFNDTIDFTGGQRPGPILQFIGNVFDGAGDDHLDLDSTDAWIEGNVFMHVHRDPNRTDRADDTASAISGGVDFDGQFSEWTVINNLFYDVDHACLNKGGAGNGAGRFIFVNNTLVHVNQESGGGPSTNIAAFIFTDDQVPFPSASYGAGAYIANNIIWDCPMLATNYSPAIHTIIFENNILPGAWGGLGSNNVVTDPLLNLQLIPNVTNATAAQVRAALTPKANSPALRTGFGGLDKGGLNPPGLLFISGPVGNTSSSSASLRLYPGGVFHWGTVAPNYDWGYTHYKWRLDDGPWSGELAISNAPVINLSGLPNGSHTVYVVGRNDAGYYQDDPFVYPADGVIPAHITASHTWTINSPGSGIRINEILASNQNAVNHEGTYPDLIELRNITDVAIDLGGLRLTDDQTNPDKFIIPGGTTVPAGGYLVFYANNPDGTSGIHVGFNLSKGGQSLYLYDTVDHGGVVIDSVTFGLQVSDYSIGRVGPLPAASAWTLCVPSPGAANIPAATGMATQLVINEILAAELTSFSDDFVEIHNPQNVPVAMAGLYFTDNPAHWPNRSLVPPLTFIGSNDYIAFRADGQTDKGSDHLAFQLEAERGIVALLNADYSLIDCLIYGPQSTDISQGRSPDNSNQNNFFTTPTPGAPNPGLVATNSGVVINEVLAANSTIRELDGSTPDWIELFNLSATNIDLGDFSLSDSSMLARKYVFAPGTMISANGYLRLLCDSSLPASTTNTGFNIKAEGGSVYLFDKLAHGGALLNAVSYGLQAVDFSISRVPNGTGPWALTIPTPNGASIPAALANVNSVRINEWMAAPSSGEDWFELWNPNPQPVAIGGYYTTDDLNNRTKSPIPALSYLGASTNGYQRFWADSSPASGANHTGFKFAAGGESIGFANPFGTLIDSITFGAQETGVSEGRFPDGTATIVRFPQTASPGAPNYLWISNVVINEALTHTDPPFEDAIELRNLTGTNINIGDWWLSDALSKPQKYRIPGGTILPANGFLVFYEYQFNSDPTNDPAHSFALSSANGDEIYLSTGNSNGVLTGYRTTVSFGPSQNGVSFGRYVTSDGNEQFVSMSARSFGQDDPANLDQFRTGTGLANPYPKVGPIVIAQIMYHPPDMGTNDNTLDEFIELRNMGGATNALYDPLNTTNTWRLRDAVDFDFPEGVALPPGGRLLVVSFDPANNPVQLAAFRAKYGAAANIPVYGPYTGKLANSDDKVELYQPDNPDAGFVPFVLADRVHYHDAAPWPAAADGTGASLQRVSLTGFGNDPTNWVAVVPNFGGAVDSDGDGMPDAYENLYPSILDPNNPADASQDPDGDGLSNLQEYLAGTDPTDPNSTLRILSIDNLGGNQVRLIFFAVANRTYTVEYKNALTGASWLPFTNITAAASDRLLPVQATLATNRFFRVRTP